MNLFRTLNDFHQLPRPPAGANQRARNREATMALNLNAP